MGLISEGAYKRRGLYPRGLINKGAYIRGDYKRRGLYPRGLITRIEKALRNKL